MDLLPVQIIHFDPVRREIVRKESCDWRLLCVDNPPPQFFDPGYFYAPYIPRILNYAAT